MKLTDFELRRKRVKRPGLGLQAILTMALLKEKGAMTAEQLRAHRPKLEGAKKERYNPLPKLVMTGDVQALDPAGDEPFKYAITPSGANYISRLITLGFSMEV